MMERLEARVSGIVQGVYFRRNTMVRAVQLGLAGTVRNEVDGSVRVVAEGERSPLEALLEWLRRGPERAVVDRVEATWGAATGAYSGFRVLS